MQPALPVVGSMIIILADLSNLSCAFEVGDGMGCDVEVEGGHDSGGGDYFFF